MDGLFNDKHLAAVYEYWQDVRGARVAPRREELNLGALKSALPKINLIDVIWGPLQFRHRLVGSDYVEMMGRDATGRFVDEELYGEAASEIFANLEMVARQAQPYRRSARLDWLDRNWLTIESAELPLVNADGRVNMIMRVSNFTITKNLDKERLLFTPLTQTISL